MLVKLSPALPPINAKLIFVDRTNLTIPDMVEPYSEDGQLMSHLEVEEGENLPTVKLEVPHELPSGRYIKKYFCT